MLQVGRTKHDAVVPQTIPRTYTAARQLKRHMTSRKTSATTRIVESRPTSVVNDTVQLQNVTIYLFIYLLTYTTTSSILAEGINVKVNMVVE